MLISHTWLKDFFGEELPSIQAVKDAIEFHAFEVEDVYEQNADTVFDIDVTPNRAHDCLCHRGIAREVAINTRVSMQRDPLREEISLEPRATGLHVQLDDTSACRRYAAAVLSDVSVGESPQWLQDRLRAIGQQPINNVVDATNYVMFSLGQPLHAFDADKVTAREAGRTIRVREARDDESITLLGGDERALPAGTLVITDGSNDQLLGVAGVKGGTHAEVGQGTTTVILESANFDPVRIRKAARALKLQTDASLRFENAVAPDTAAYALHEAVSLIERLANATLEGYADAGARQEPQPTIDISVQRINSVLGTTLDHAVVQDILDRFNFAYEGAFSVTPPFERTDLAITEDLIEEVGRVYGYNHIESYVPEEPAQPPKANPHTYYANTVQDTLLELGFSEVMTYSLQKKGVAEIANPLANDKSHVRKNLSRGLFAALEHNAQYIDLLALTDIRIFEIGHAVTKEGERRVLGMGVYQRGGKAAPQSVLNEAQQRLEEVLGCSISNHQLSADVSGGMAVAEYDFDALLKTLPQPSEYRQTESTHAKITFQPLSPYPFVLRDIAVWVPQSTNSGELLSVIRDAAGALLTNWRLFDTYERGEYVSYAFRLVFLSYEQTLSDEEVNEVMDRVHAAVDERGWHVR